jgi:hypothetical protein
MSNSKELLKTVSIPEIESYAVAIRNPKQKFKIPNKLPDEVKLYPL